MTDTNSVATDRLDAISRLAGISPDLPAAKLLAERPTIVKNAQASYEALLESDDVGSVSPYERALVALRVAVLTPSAAVAARQREQLRQLGASAAAIAAIEGFPNGGEVPPRQAALMRFADRLTREPGAASPSISRRSRRGDLGRATLSRLPSLFLLRASRCACWPGCDCFRRRRERTTKLAFTQDVLTWRPWLETIDEVEATPEQVALVKEVAPSANGRPLLRAAGRTTFPRYARAPRSSTA